MKRKFSKWIISVVASVMLFVPGTVLAAPENGWMVATQADGYIAVNEIVTATESVVVHQEPSDNSPVLGELQQGQQVTRIGVSSTSGWNRIEFNGQVAYVWGEYVKTEAELNQSSNTGFAGVTETPDDMYVQAVQNSIIRSVPDTSGEILGYFNNGDVAHRIAICSNTWSKIEFNGIVGYIGGQIIGTSAPENSTPETPAPETPAPETPAPETSTSENPIPEPSVEPSETETLEETLPEETNPEETSTEEATEAETVESTEKGTKENSTEQNTESLEDSSTGEETSAADENTKKSETSQVSIWKIVFFVFIILLVVNTVILIVTLLKKDNSDDLDDVDDDEDDDEPDGDNN